MTDKKTLLDRLRAALAAEESREMEEMRAVGAQVDPDLKADAVRDEGHFTLQAAVESIEGEALHQWILSKGYSWADTRGPVRVYEKDGHNSVLAPSGPGAWDLADFARAAMMAIIGVCCSNGERSYDNVLQLAKPPETWGDGGEGNYRERLKDRAKRGAK